MVFTFPNIAASTKKNILFLVCILCIFFLCNSHKLSSQSYTVPFSGSNSITTCSGTVRDHAGTSSYSDNALGYTVINPSVSGNVVRLSGFISTETNYDIVNIYNGVGTAGTLLWTGSGSISGIVITSTSGPLTIEFETDVSITNTGFEFTISCVTSTVPPSPTSISATSISVCTGSSTQLTVNGGSGTTYWFSGSCGISGQIGTGTSITVSPTTTTTYYARNRSGTTWSTSCASIIVSIIAVPAIPANPTSNSPQCNTVTLTRSGTPPTGVTWYWQGTTANGTSTTLGSGTTYSATASGTYYIRARNSSGCWSTGIGSRAVTITAPAAPANPTSNSPQCGSVTITRSGTPATGITWYWQGTTANGTSTTLGTGTTYTATASGTYYIRARNSSGCWSNSSGSVVVSANAVPAVPPTPTSNSPQCGTVTLTRSGTPPSGITWYWQGTTANGTSTTLGSGTTYSVTTSGTYYLRARNTSGCWSSTSASIVVTVSSAPANPSNLTSNSPQCSTVTISRTGTPPTVVTWYWQGTNANGTSTSLGTGTTYAVTASGTYYLRARNSAGCWSVSSAGLTVTISATAAPPNPTSNSPQCGPVTINRTGTPPSGFTWYWQGSNANGTSTTLGSGATFTANSSGTYYIRALNSSGCWSTNSSPVSATVSTAPTSPTSITGNTSICSGASTSLSAIGGSEGSGATYEWFASSCGSTVIGTNSTLTVSPATVTTYYLRRKGIAPCGGTVTTCVSITVTVIPSPTAPTLISGVNTICAGRSTTLSVSGGSDGSGASFEWFASSCGSTVIGTGTTISLSPTITTTYFVRRRATASCNNATTSCISFTVNVSNLPVATVSPAGNQLLCLNSNLVLTANSGSGISYQWTLNGNNIANANSSVLLAQDTGQYAVIITNSAGCTSISDIINVSEILPVISGNTSICSGDTLRLTVDGLPNYSYTWQFNGTNIVGAQDTVLLVSTAGSYSVIATNSGGCSGINTVNVISALNPVVNIQSNGTTNICSNEILNINTGQTFQNYQWLYNGQPIINAQNNNIEVNTAGNYSLFATDNNGCSAVSNPISVTVRTAPPFSITQSGPMELCGGDSLVLTSSSSLANLWSTGLISQSISILNSGTYSLTVTDGICSSVSQEYIVTVYDKPVVNILDTIVSASVGGNAQILSSNLVNNANHQWQMKENGIWESISDTSMFSGTSSSVLTIYNLDLSYDNSEFRLIAANAFCYDTSATVRLNISNTNVAVNNVESELFEVYPNPFSEVLYITDHHYLKNESYSIELYNASGQVVLSTTLRNSQDFIIFDKGLQSGFYFLIVRDRDKKLVFYNKLIKS